MSGDFLDSNVLIYVMDDRDERKSGLARSIVARGLKDGACTISFQVVHETLAVLTGKMARPVTPTQASAFLDNILEPLWKVMPTALLYRRALEFQARYEYHFYDSLILAAAATSGCDRLLSEDFQHDQTIEGLTIHNPFL